MFILFNLSKTAVIGQPSWMDHDHCTQHLCWGASRAGLWQRTLHDDAGLVIRGKAAQLGPCFPSYLKWWFEWTSEMSGSPHWPSSTVFFRGSCVASSDENLSQHTLPMKQLLSLQDEWYLKHWCFRMPGVGGSHTFANSRKFSMFVIRPWLSHSMVQGISSS